MLSGSENIEFDITYVWLDIPFLRDHLYSFKINKDSYSMQDI